MTKKNANATHKIVRKIGEREEVIEHHLSREEMAEVQDTVMALLDQKQEVEEKKVETNANYNAQFKAIDLQLETARRVFRGGVRKESVIIEEHLTAANEVIRIRKGTREIIGQRTATADELQEEMFADDKAESGDVPQDEAPVETDAEEAAESTFGGQPE